MLVVQHNCRKAYPVTIAALESGLQLGADLVCLQEPYIMRDFSHSGYLIHWPEEGARKNARVAVAVRRDTLNKRIIEARTDLINHPYFLVVDVWDLERGSRKQVRRTRVVNCYDNWIGEGQVWQGQEARRRRAIEDADWARLLQGRCLVLGDFNAHSTLWNPQASTRTNAGPLEAIIEAYELYVNNDPEEATRPKNTPGNSIIDLAISTPELGPLPGWYVDTAYPTPSDHVLIVMEWEELQQSYQETSQDTTGWRIQELLAD
jgi:hypothetical protein